MYFLYGFIFYSYLLSPEFYFLLFKISPFFLVNKNQIEEVTALKSIVYVWICGGKICARKIKSNWNTFSFNWSPIHYFEFIQVFSLSDSILSASHNLLLYYAEFHMFNLDPD